LLYKLIDVSTQCQFLVLDRNNKYVQKLFLSKPIFWPCKDSFTTSEQNLVKNVWSHIPKEQKILNLTNCFLFSLVVVIWLKKEKIFCAKTFLTHVIYILQRRRLSRSTYITRDVIIFVIVIVFFSQLTFFSFFSSFLFCLHIPFSVYVTVDYD